MKEPVLFDLRDLTRIDEVREYADFRGISLDEAVKELVNKGLSHWTKP